MLFRTGVLEKLTDNCISISPRNPRIWLPGQIAGNTKVGNTLVKPQFLPVPSCHFPCADPGKQVNLHPKKPGATAKSTPLVFGCGSRSLASPKSLRQGTFMVSHGLSHIHVRLMEGMLWNPPKKIRRKLNLPLLAGLRTCVLRKSNIVREWLLVNLDAPKLLDHFMSSALCHVQQFIQFFKCSFMLVGSSEFPNGFW